MKHVYYTDSFNKENYINKPKELKVVASQCNCSSILLYLNKMVIDLRTIQRVEFNKNDEYQLILYTFYEETYDIIKVKIEDFENFEDVEYEFTDFVGDILCWTFVNNEVEY